MEEDDDVDSARGKASMMERFIGTLESVVCVVSEWALWNE